MMMMKMARRVLLVALSALAAPGAFSVAHLDASDEDALWGALERRRLNSYKNDYTKPSPEDSSKMCFRATQKIRQIYFMNPVDAVTGARYPIRGCLACNPTIGAPSQLCPNTAADLTGREYDCQELIDVVFDECAEQENTWSKDERAKKLPDGFYFDPEDRLDGKWSEGIASQMRVLAQKCGCDAASSLGLTTLAGLVLLLAPALLSLLL